MTTDTPFTWVLARFGAARSGDRRTIGWRRRRKDEDRAVSVLAIEAYGAPPAAGYHTDLGAEPPRPDPGAPISRS